MIQHFMHNFSNNPGKKKSLDDKQIKIQYISFHDYTFKLFSIERGLFITLKKM